MINRRSILKSFAGVASIVPATTLGAHADRTCVSGSETLHFYSYTLRNFGEDIPDAYRIALNVGPAPSLREDPLPQRHEAAIAEYLALQCVRGLVSSAMYYAFLEEEGHRCRDARTLDAAYEACFEGYKATWDSRGDDSPDSVWPKCAHYCAHFGMAAVQAAKNPKFTAHAGDFSARIVWEQIDGQKAAGTETSWVWDEALAVLKGAINLESRLTAADC